MPDWKSEMPDNVRCSDCGYLAVVNTQTGLPEEANDGFRKRRDIPPITPRGNQNRFEEFPLCYRKVCDFRKEATSSSPEHVIEVMARNRTCDLFRDRHPGKSPKELEEMEILLKVEQKHAEYHELEKREREEYRKADLAMRESVAATVAATGAEQELRNERRHRKTSRIAILAIVVAIIAAAAAVARVILHK